MKKILICGGAGFIGHHLARKLKYEGNIVVVADIKPLDSPDCYLHPSDFDHYIQGNLPLVS